MKLSDSVQFMALPGVLVLQWTFLFGCSTSTSPGPADVPQVIHDQVAPDLVKRDVQDLAPADVSDFSVPDVPTDVGKELPSPSCVPGSGCFLEKCAEDSECASGWCVEHLGEGVCSQVCQDECPAGWSCKYAAGIGKEAIFVCISDFANLCRPCTTGADCKSAGGADDVCVDYGPEGGFCGGPCVESKDCPWAFSCKDVNTVEGVATKQCVFDAGVCPCTAKSTAVGASTLCQVSNEFGVCTGIRSCTQNGLSPCDAIEPEKEVCNGIDDDCDGQTDELQFLDGKFIELCNDGNDCTEDSCGGAGGCIHTPLDGDGCDDGNTCTGPDHCTDGACTGGVVDCDDNNPCTDDECNPETGCKVSFNVIPCDDGNGCTVEDSCKDGVCVGKQTVDCNCTTDQECKQFDDQDLCNGFLKCIGQDCVTDPATVVLCDSSNTPACHVSACVPETGECKDHAVADGIPCDDANKCTGNDACQAGTCLPGGTVSCDDGNLCTDDACKPDSGCVHADISASCSDDNPCTDDGCAPETGCIHTGNTNTCDDGNKCTSGEACAAGVCAGGKALNCDDLNPCTSDTCVPLVGCVHVNNTDPCDDGDPCTETDVCKDGGCIGTGVPSCDDGNACTKDYCASPAGCFNKPLTGTLCEDGNLCMTGDLCQAGVCQPGVVPASCEDGNPCTDNFCSNPAVGCQYSNNSGPCGDGNACTEDDSCFGGKCYAGPQADCEDEVSCTLDSCDPSKGCIHLPEDALCDDESPLTTDVCVPLVGCTYESVTLPCGNGLCDNGETQCSCPEDCKSGCDCCDGPSCVANASKEKCGKNASSCEKCLGLDECIDGACSGDLKWILVPGGTFKMGCSSGDASCQDDEKPAHQVSVTAFWMLETEVTETQYKATTGSKPPCDSGAPSDVNLPVACVTWSQAKAVCEAVGGRLPTEAEWEYAARAGTTTKYYCGDNASCLDGIAWSSANSGGQRHSVKGKAPNKFGLYDMLGNLWELTQDCWHDNYYGAPAAAYPSWGLNCGGADKALRGGSFEMHPKYSYAYLLRVSVRTGIDPAEYHYHIGFRCAKTVKP